MTEPLVASYSRDEQLIGLFLVTLGSVVTRSGVMLSDALTRLPERVEAESEGPGPRLTCHCQPNSRRPGERSGSRAVVQEEVGGTARTKLGRWLGLTVRDRVLDEFSDLMLNETPVTEQSIQLQHPYKLCKSPGLCWQTPNQPNVNQDRKDHLTKQHREERPPLQSKRISSPS